VIDVQQAEVSPMTASPPAENFSPQGSAPIKIRTRSDNSCAQGSDAGEVVVCGSRHNDENRLRPLKPPPVLPSLLSRPLRIQIAPGVSLGFQRGGGFGLRAELGPGKKTDEIER
jgi:hypothetical protein